MSGTTLNKMCTRGTADTRIGDGEHRQLWLSLRRPTISHLTRGASVKLEALQSTTNSVVAAVQVSVAETDLVCQTHLTGHQAQINLESIQFVVPGSDFNWIEFETRKALLHQQGFLFVGLNRGRGRRRDMSLWFLIRELKSDVGTLSHKVVVSIRC